MKSPLQSFIYNYSPKKFFDGKGKKVLITMMRPVSEQYIEIIFAKVLKANNFKPVILFANSEMFLEDYQFRNDYRKYTGWIKYRFLFKLVHNKRLRLYKKVCRENEIPFKEIPKNKIKKTSLFSQDALNNIQSSFKRIRAGVPSNIPSFLKKRIHNNIFDTENFLDKNDYDFCISSHGIYSLWGPVYKKMKGNILIWGGDVYNKSSLLVSKGPIQLSEPIHIKNKKKIANSSFEKWYQSRSLRRSSDQEAFDNSNTKFYYYGKIRNMPLDDNLSSIFKKDKTNVVIMPNTLWDGDIYGRNQAFDGQIDWIERTASIKDIRLIIRAHPAEKSLKKYSPKIWDLISNETKKNIVYFPSDFMLNSYDFAELADVCCIYDSIIGIELNGLGRDVIICANNRHYLDKGWDVPKTFRDYKNRLLNRKLNENRYELAKQSYNRLINGSIYIPFWEGETNVFIDDLKKDNRWEDEFIKIIMDNYKDDRK